MNNPIIGIHIIYHRLRHLVYSNSGVENARVNIHPSNSVGEKTQTRKKFSVQKKKIIKKTVITRIKNLRVA